MSSSRVFGFVCIAFLICGCTKTVRQRAAEYQPGIVPTTQPVRASGVYSIRFVDASGKKFGGISSSHVYLNKGEPVGFAFDEEGKLRGIAGTYSFSIDAPQDHGLVWSTTHRRPTQFGREVAKVAVPSFETARDAWAIVGVSSIWGLALYAGWIEFRMTFPVK
jgi:hypothetical protein